jgi:hypothetical protein
VRQGQPALLVDAPAPPAAALDEDDDDGGGDDELGGGQFGKMMPGEHDGLGLGLVVGGLVVGGAEVVGGALEVDALVDGVDGAVLVDGAVVVGVGVCVGAGAPISCLFGSCNAGLPASHLSMNSCHALPGRSRPYSGAP